MTIVDDKLIAEEANRLRSEALQRINADGSMPEEPAKDLGKESTTGASLDYFQLPYGERLKNTLRASPMMLIFFLFPADAHFKGLGRNGALALVFVLFVIQAGYNYYMWKNTEQKAEPRRHLGDGA